MNYHFMIRVPGLSAEVTLANFPPNDSGAPWPSDQVAHAIWSDGEKWQIRSLRNVETGAAATFGEQDVPEDAPGDALVSYFLYPSSTDGAFDEPIVSDHLETSPSWRGNIMMRSATAATSYQGEYPSGMVNIPKGTLLSIGSMVQAGAGLHNKFILVNMRRDPALDTAELCFVDAADCRILKTAVATFNRHTIVDLDDFDVQAEQLIAVTSDGITGIPLYLTHDDGYRHLSFEHTHPPAEVVVFGDRNKVQQTMKTRWLTAVSAQRASNRAESPKI